MWQNLNGKKAFNLYIEPNWMEGDSGLWYIHRTVLKKEYLKVELPEISKGPLFDHDRVAEILSDSLDEEISPNDLPIDNLEYLNKDRLKISYEGGAFILNLEDYTVQIPEKEEKEDEHSTESPDGKWVAFTKDYNLYVRSTATGKERQLSFKGRKGHEYGTWYGWGDIMEGEGGERPKRFYVDWSPDSRYIRTSIINMDDANKMYLLDWSVDTLYRPRLLGYYRGSPGDNEMVYDFPVIFEVQSEREMILDIGKPTHINTASVRWRENSGSAIANYAERGYQRQYLKLIDLNTGKLKPLYEETSETNIDNFRWWILEDQGKILFTSEQSGWRQLYLLDLNSGEVEPFTSGDYYVNDVISREENILFLASGREEGSNPYHQYLYKQHVDDRASVLLTPELLHHQISLSLDKKYFVDNMSTSEIPTVTVLRSADDGAILDTLGVADVSILKEQGWGPPETFTATARDGQTTIYGAMWKPTNFDQSRKYPVIDHSYTGPHTQMYPRDFRRVLSVSNQALAELGFVVIMVDGLGSARRSKAFHDYSYKNLGGNLEDHVLAIKQLGERYRWVDTSRVGIFGHSAGGYDAAHGLLQFPGFYDVGVASSADHDHRMEKAWWPEMYMGWPVDSAYHKQSNITMAGNLKGKLLITHGGIDENVNPSATFKLAEALVRADKQFDLMIFPSQRHGYRDEVGEYFRKLRWNYFVEHLLGAEPVWDFSWGEEDN